MFNPIAQYHDNTTFYTKIKISVGMSYVTGDAAIFENSPYKKLFTYTFFATSFSIKLFLTNTISYEILKYQFK